MSGGIAYVSTRRARAGQLNTEMVDLEALDEDDAEFLHELIQAHVDATDSAVGQRILADWRDGTRHFVKVMPQDYKRVLAAIAEAERDGRDVDAGDHGGRAVADPRAS